MQRFGGKGLLGSIQGVGNGLGYFTEQKPASMAGVVGGEGKSTGDETGGQRSARWRVPDLMWPVGHVKEFGFISK